MHFYWLQLLIFLLYGFNSINHTCLLPLAPHFSTLWLWLLHTSHIFTDSSSLLFSCMALTPYITHFLLTPTVWLWPQLWLFVNQFISIYSNFTKICMLQLWNPACYILTQFGQLCFPKVVELDAKSYFLDPPFQTWWQLIPHPILFLSHQTCTKASTENDFCIVLQADIWPYIVKAHCT